MTRGTPIVEHSAPWAGLIIAIPILVLTVILLYMREHQDRWPR